MPGNKAKAEVKRPVDEEEDQDDVADSGSEEDANGNGADAGDAPNGADDDGDAKEDASNGKKTKSKRAQNNRNKKSDKKAAKSSKKKSTVVRKAADDDNADAANGDSKDASLSETKVEKRGDDYRSATGVLISQPTSRDVKIGNFTLLSHGQELIKDTTIEFTIGRRYGLIGFNGAGKSTFLKCLAAREVPIPAHIDIFLLEEEAAPENKTALECVVEAVEGKIKQYEREAEKAIETYGPDSDIAMDLYERLDALDPRTFKTRAAKILVGLGFDKTMLAKHTKDMSGGWRMRVALAQALFVRPTLLLLDEPTNHLDLEGVVWLEKYLATYDRCLVVVSHSQDFLNNVCTNTIHINMQRKLQVYGGNYDTFIQVKTENEVNQMKRYRKEQDDIKHLKAFIASCGTYSNLVRQGKSKQKIIDKMVAAGLTEAVVKEPAFNFRFPEVERLPPPVLAFHDVAFTYSGDMKHALYQHLNLGVTLDSRIALVGPNGAGKSTLLKLMGGELTPTAGLVKRHIHLNMARYHQHSTDQLDPEMSPLDYIQFVFKDRPQQDIDIWRQQLGRYGVRGAQQTSKIGKMSDGQKSRLVFAIMAYTRPHILMLDEPTNHLDIECIDSLAEAINHYNGGLILVSHDFRLIDQVAKEIWVCDNNAVTIWNGGIREYKKKLIQRMHIMEQQQAE